MSIYRQVVDGAVQVPLPDDPVARAKAFAEVAAAWSTMLSSIEHLLPNGKAATLTGNPAPPAIAPQPSYAWRQALARPVVEPYVMTPAPPVAEPAKPNGKRVGRPPGSKGKKRRSR